MNWKILLAGGATIFFIFISFFGFQAIKKRNKIQTDLTTLQTSTVRFKDGVIPLQARKAIEQEVKTQNQLIRGRVSSYNQTNSSFTVAMEQLQYDGSMGVVGLIEVVVNPKLIDEFLCWNEYPESPTGATADMKKIFISLTGNSFLYMQGESKHLLSKLSNSLNNSPYVFALLATPLKAPDLTRVKDTSNIGPQNVTELAILGCNDK